MYNNVVKMEIFSARGTHSVHIQQVEVHRASRFGASTSKAGDGRPKKCAVWRIKYVYKR